MLGYQSSAGVGSNGSAKLYTLLAEYPRRDGTEVWLNHAGWKR
ncbi:MAG: hypothetical protein ABI977_03255 [Acidobacteriota bacterium]